MPWSMPAAQSTSRMSDMGMALSVVEMDIDGFRRLYRAVLFDGAGIVVTDLTSERERVGFYFDAVRYAPTIELT